MNINLNVIFFLVRLRVLSVRYRYGGADGTTYLFLGFVNSFLLKNKILLAFTQSQLTPRWSRRLVLTESAA
jgi:hypothetical protein